MTTQQFPYQAWVLSPSYVPKEVTVAKRVGIGNFESDKGAWLHASDLYPTKQAAIDAGLAKLEAAEARLKKQAETVAKRRANLEKQK